MTVYPQGWRFPRRCDLLRLVGLLLLGCIFFATTASGQEISGTAAVVGRASQQCGDNAATYYPNGMVNRILRADDWNKFRTNSSDDQRKAKWREGHGEQKNTDAQICDPSGLRDDPTSWMSQTEGPVLVPYIFNRPGEHFGATGESWFLSNDLVILITFSLMVIGLPVVLFAFPHLNPSANGSGPVAASSRQSAPTAALQSGDDRNYPKLCALCTLSYAICTLLSCWVGCLISAVVVYPIIWKAFTEQRRRLGDLDLFASFHSGRRSVRAMFFWLGRGAWRLCEIEAVEFLLLLAALTVVFTQVGFYLYADGHYPKNPGIPSMGGQCYENGEGGSERSTIGETVASDTNFPKSGLGAGSKGTGDGLRQVRATNVVAPATTWTGSGASMNSSESKPNNVASLSEDGRLKACLSWVERSQDLNSFSGQDGANPLNMFAINYWAGASYVFLSIFCLGHWLIACTHQHRASLGLILVSYLGLGMVMASLYHNLYLKHIGRYNAFVASAAVRSAAERETRLGVDESKNLFLKVVGEKNVKLLPDPINLLTKIRIQEQSSEVFAMDKPQRVETLSGVDDPHEDFDGTLQFFSGDKEFRSDCPHNPLILGRTPLNMPSRMDLNNEAMLMRFRQWLQTLKNKPVPSGRLEYRVEIYGSADLFGGDSKPNESLARNRADTLQKQLVRLVEAYPSAHASFLLYQLNGAKLQNIFQNSNGDLQRIGDIQRGLNPDSFSGVSDSVRQEAFRAARVKVLRLTNNPAASTRVQMGLADNASFMDMLYFSFVTFTTTGYGDIRPVSREARCWSTLQNILELIFTSIFFVNAFQLGKIDAPQQVVAKGKAAGAP